MAMMLIFLHIFRNIVYVLIVFYHWRNRSFSLTKHIPANNKMLLKFNYDKTNNSVNLFINKIT